MISFASLIFNSSCDPGGGADQAISFAIFNADADYAQKLCGTSNQLVRDDEIEYEVTIYTYDQNGQPRRWGNRNYFNGTGDRIENIEIPVPSEGEFAIEVKGTSKQCTLTSECNSFCGKRTFYQLTSRHAVQDNIEGIYTYFDGYKCC